MSPILHTKMLTVNIAHNAEYVVVLYVESKPYTLHLIMLILFVLLVLD